MPFLEWSKVFVRLRFLTASKAVYDVLKHLNPSDSIPAKAYYQIKTADLCQSQHNPRHDVLGFHYKPVWIYHTEFIMRDRCV